MLLNFTFMNIQNIISINTLWSTKKIYTKPYSVAFFMLSTVKSFEVLPKHIGYEFKSQSFALN